MYLKTPIAATLTRNTKLMDSTGYRMIAKDTAVTITGTREELFGTGYDIRVEGVEFTSMVRSSAVDFTYKAMTGLYRDAILIKEVPTSDMLAHIQGMEHADKRDLLGELYAAVGRDEVIRLHGLAVLGCL